MKLLTKLGFVGLILVSCTNASPSLKNITTATPEKWSEAATWGGTLPGTDAAVVIPAGKTVVLDINAPRLKSLEIRGTLQFINRNIELRSGSIMVHGGKLQIGSSAVPFTRIAKITLYGQDTGTEVMTGMGEKVLGAMMGGTIEMYGASRGKSWTRLAATANVGDTVITLDGAPGWKVGDRIALASTDYDPSQAEEAVISAVDGNQVTLGAPLKYMHFGQTQTFADKTLESRGEVALLSRNITISGGDGSIPTGFGGHIMMMDTSIAKFENVEFTQLGQRGKLKRYPIHFHMQGDSSTGSFVRGSAIHNNFNRCLTIHGSGGIEIKNNAAYNTVGHCYFLEDGSETGNKLEGNLGFGTRRPDTGKGEIKLLPTDQEPATYWITNPQNDFVGNVAAGSAFFGFWIALPQRPTGPSATDSRFANMYPRRTAMGLFQNNLAHSNESTGLNVDGGPKAGTLESEPAYLVARANPVPPAPGQADSAIVPVVFDGFQAYKNRGRGVWLRGSTHILKNAVIADSAIGATFASDETIVQSSVFVGETANKGTPKDYEKDGRVGLDGRTLPYFWEPSFPIRGFEFYDGKVGVDDVTFVNFASNTQRLASGLSYLRFTNFSVNAANFAKNLRFVNANAVNLKLENPEPTAPNDDGMDGYRSAAFVDEDGSVTGTANRAVVVSNPFLLNENCVARTDWNAHVCNNVYGRFQLESANYSTTAPEISPVTLKRLEGANPTHKLWGLPNDGANRYFESRLILGKSYEVNVNGAMQNRTRLHLRDRPSGSWIRVSIPWSGSAPFMYRDYNVYKQVNSGGTVTYNSILSPVADATALNALTTTGYFISGGKLHMKLIVPVDANDATRDWTTIDICTVDNCGQPADVRK
jgi:cell surface hyaluronidase